MSVLQTQQQSRRKQEPLLELGDVWQDFYQMIWMSSFFQGGIMRAVIIQL